VGSRRSWRVGLEHIHQITPHHLARVRKPGPQPIYLQRRVPATFTRLPDDRSYKKRRRWNILRREYQPSAAKHNASLLPLDGRARPRLHRHQCRTIFMFKNIDPIVFPGQYVSHMHSFFGSDAVNINTSTSAELREGCSTARNPNDFSVYCTSPSPIAWVTERL
jgi:hypothetical protein